MNKTAIIVGSTGVTGSILLNKLLNDNRYKLIKTFSRTSNNLRHPKLQEHIVDLLQPRDYSHLFEADEVHCCIGTTKSKTPDKKQYYKIDFGIPVTLAGLCYQNNIKTFIVISALGANAKSSVFYSRTKGEMEEAVLEQYITNTFILQPALIDSKRKEERVAESIFINIMKLINPMLVGKFKKYRSVPAEKIASAMIWLANNSYSDFRIPSDLIQKLGKK